MGLEAVTIDCSDARTLAGFWAAVFDTSIESESGEGPHYVDLRPVVGVVPLLRFQRVPERKALKNRVHLDVEVQDIETARVQIEALGGSVVTEAISEYGYDFIVMADPEGNEFCLVHR